MGYFRYLSLILGVYMSVAWIWVMIFPDKYKALASKVLPEKKPVWFTIASWVTIAFVAFTWYKFLQTPTALTLGISLVMGLMLLKPLWILRNYPHFHKFATEFILLPNSMLRMLGIFIIGLGILMTAIGLAI
ncbi:MAG: hypothetical protein JW893_00980 [Candidatus Omnitrophica bacterium]|nr:hypothetical protein [Candidatus Omnitrophota bacterium]